MTVISRRRDANARRKDRQRDVATILFFACGGTSRRVGDGLCRGLVVSERPRSGGVGGGGVQSEGGGHGLGDGND